MLLSPVVLAYWLFGAGFLLLMGFRRHKTHTVTLSIFGIATLGVAWLALLDMWYVHGAWYLLSMLAVVWFTDTFAYFVGRRWGQRRLRSEEHTSELQSRGHLVCRLLLEKKK